MLLLDLFISQNRLTENDAREIETGLKEHEGVIIDDLLASKKITNEEILQVRSVLFGLPVYKSEIRKDVSLSKFISSQQSRQMLAVPLLLKDEVLFVGVVDPERANVLESLQFLFNGQNRIYKVFLISNDDFKVFMGDKINVIEDASLADNVNSGIKSNASVSSSDKTKIENSMNTVDETMLDLSDVDAVLDENLQNLSIPEIISIVLRYAIDHGASDLHIENIGNDVRVRCRTDGRLETIVTLPVKIDSMLVARIKILCSMKLDEKRKPQDGRFSTKMNDHSIDYRVSTFPSYYGEKVVIRILDSYRGVRSMDTLGFSNEQIEQIRKALSRPYGIILITGPTGSGKTTTLYSMLNEIDRDHRNVVSLEDPIEYNVPSMNQSQVFPEIGYTFATGLRSVLRQDPDVIMVGEIRDAETAQLAIQAALTGHLVFSTIHTNTAIGVITRLLDMGIEPYLIAPTLVLTIGQRLVRSIAKGCAHPLPMDPGMQAMIDEQFKDLPTQFKSGLPLNKSFNEAEGNEENPSGLKGRVPVLEVLTVDEEIESLILKNEGEAKIWQTARSKGMLSMKEDAMIKSMEGKIPFSDIHEL